MSSPPTKTKLSVASLNPHPRITAFSLTGQDDHALHDAIHPAVGDPTPARIRAVVANYKANPAWELFAVQRAGDIQSIIGVEHITSEELRIRHIATAEATRNQGQARALVEYVLSLSNTRVVWAETDGDAIDFYEKCEFKVESLGEQYPGVIRYRCTRRR